MNQNNKWIFITGGIALFLLVVLVPLAFLAGRVLPQESPTPVSLIPTQTSTPVLVFTPVTVAPTETSTPENTAVPTETPVPLDTATPLPTLTLAPTLVPTSLPPTVTPTPAVPCDWAQFVSDVSVPDGSLFAPGAGFTKIWRIKNIGTCTWSTAYTLNFSTGTAMTNQNRIVNLPASVKPGETVDIKVKLSAPVAPGLYAGNWVLKNASGTAFGGGTQANQPFDVSIVVLNVDPDVAYDLVLNMCSATWVDSNDKKLPCPGTAAGTAGFVVLLTKPVMEHRTENEPAIWVNPDHRSDGKVSGTYPSYNVKAGDHFLAWVGCLAGNSGCNVTFELKYKKANGNVFSLGSWTEVLDGEVTVIDIDLTPIEGQNIMLMLSVAVNNTKADKANAFWFAPRIENQSP